MGGIFDSLFSVLPIVLAILWLIRRTTKSTGKRQQTKKPERDDNPTVRGIRSRSASIVGGRPQSAEKAERKFGAIAIKGIKSFLGESVSMPKEGSSRGEEALYDKIEDRKIERPKPAAAKTEAQVGTHRTLMNKTESDDASLYNQRSETSLERISKLSPLAQGILWSFILEEPPGMKDL